MSGLDLSSKSSSRTDANTVGGQSQTAPVSPVYVQGDKSAPSVQIVQNVSYTDAGAMQTAENLGGAAIDLTNNINDRSIATVNESINSNTTIVQDVLGMTERLADGIGIFALDIVKEMTFTTENALAAAADASAQSAAVTRDAIDSNTLISRDAMDLSRSVVTLTDDLHSTNTQFLTGALNEYTGSLSDTVTRLDNSRNQESAASLEAITELATVVQTGGESINANVNKLIAGLAIAVAGLIAWRALG